MTDKPTHQTTPDPSSDPTREGDPPPVRDDRGRFLPGNPGSPGRPPKATEDEYHRATMDGCGVEDWRRIVARAVEDCESPKVTERNAARAFLLRAIFGQAPGAMVQIANLNQDPNPLGTARRLLKALGDFASAEHPEHAASLAAILVPFGERLVKAGGRPEDMGTPDAPKGLAGSVSRPYARPSSGSMGPILGPRPSSRAALASPKAPCPEGHSWDTDGNIRRHFATKASAWSPVTCCFPCRGILPIVAMPDF